MVSNLHCPKVPMPALHLSIISQLSTRRFLIFLLGVSCILILPQCSEKNSAEYVKEGLEYIEQQDFDNAEVAFLRAIDKNPKNSEAYYGVGGIYNYRQQYDKAIATFRKAIKMDPTHIDAHYSLGYAHEQLGDHEAAEKEFAIYNRLKTKMNAALKKEQEKH